MRVKLQNIVYPLRKNGEPAFPWELCCKGVGLEAEGGTGVLSLQKGETADFSTYFNALSLLRWGQFSVARDYHLELDIEGRASVQFVALNKKKRKYYNESFEVVPLEMADVQADQRRTVSLPVPQTDAPLVSFTVTAEDRCAIYGGCYSAMAGEDEIRDVSIAITTTTFRKEAFIRENAALIKEHVLGEGSELHGKVWFNIIDNGRTLDPEQFNGAYTRLIPNPNAGGSGGYARGMMEAMHMEPRPTHVLLMDDDVLIMPESFFRTYYLLRIVRPEYREAFVSGAMFDYVRRSLQYEDVGSINRKTGAFGSTKFRRYWDGKKYVPNRRFELDMLKTADFIMGERLTFWKKPEWRYSGWWFCCIPMTVIQRNGLPLPLFVRGDDVEFSLRNRENFVSLNGISIWHMGFTEKFNAAMEFYQVHRNSLIIRATSGIAKPARFFFRIFVYYNKELTRFAYDNADQLLDSVEDYLAGPDFLEQNSGEAIIKRHSARNDHLVPIRELTQEPELLTADPKRRRKCNIFSRLWYYCTLNGHMFADERRLLETPAVVSNGWEYCLRTNCRRKLLLSVNAVNDTAIWRVRDVRRFKQLQKRAAAVFSRYIREHRRVEALYRERGKVWVTEAFWRSYLGLDEPES